MLRPDVRRLAALDMHGRTGTPLRRRLTPIEFVAGAGLCIGLGTLTLRTTQATVGVTLGVWLVGAGLNYLPLAYHAISLARPGALAAELADIDLASELRAYIRAQFWIALPLAIVVFALRPRLTASH